MTIGDRIKQQRLALGITIDELALELDKNRATLYRYENNEIQNIPTNVIENLAKALNTNPYYIMGWGDKK